MVHCGVADVPVDEEKPINKNELDFEDLKMMTQVESLPYALEFSFHVSKVMCGDMFFGLLTADGHVYT